MTEEIKKHPHLTARGLLELIEHEGIVPEWYKDDVGVGTWGIGVTNKSGHRVDRYRDNPQPMEHILSIFIWLVDRVYLPPVLAAFNGYNLNEQELHAALSFQYNTGAIMTADWVADFKAGFRDQARASIMNWRSPSSIIPRRKAERDLFFDGKWTSDGKVPVYGVRKPSYTPGNAILVDIKAHLQLAIEKNGKA